MASNLEEESTHQFFKAAYQFLKDPQTEQEYFATGFVNGIRMDVDIALGILLECAKNGDIGTAREVLEYSPRVLSEYFICEKQIVYSFLEYPPEFSSFLIGRMVRYLSSEPRTQQRLLHDLLDHFFDRNPGSLFSGRWKAGFTIIVDAGLDVNFRGKNGQTILMDMLFKDNLELVKWLVEEMGADPDIRDEEGKGIYTYATYTKSWKMQALARSLMSEPEVVPDSKGPRFY